MCKTKGFCSLMKLNNMKKNLILLFIVLPLFVFGQNKSFTLGYKTNGIVFGKSLTCNGLRLNVWDDYDSSSHNGINISVKASSVKSNGVDIGLLFLADSIANGLQIATTVVGAGETNGVSLAVFFVGGETLNGISLAGIAVGADDSNINGITVSGLGAVGSNLNGLFIGLLGANNWSESAENVNGVALGFVWGVRAEKYNGLAFGIGNYADTTNGLTLGLFYNISNKVNGAQIGLHNKTQDLYGIQFRLWNIAENKRYFKKTPIINFNFRKNACRQENKN